MKTDRRNFIQTLGTGAAGFSFNFINIWVLPLCGTGYHTVKIKIIL